MATPKEVLVKLRALTDDEFEDLKKVKTPICGANSREDFANQVVGRPEAEARICHALGIPTESDKSLYYSRRGYHLIVASLFFTLVSLVVSIATLLR